MSRIVNTSVRAIVAKALSVFLSGLLTLTLLQTAPVANASSLECNVTNQVVFDGTSLRRIYDFTEVGTCTWSVPAEISQGTSSQLLLVAGGDGGSEGVGGYGGEASTYWVSVASGDTVEITVGDGGIGETATPAQPGGLSSVTIGNSKAIVASPSISTTSSNFSTLGTAKEFGGTQAPGQSGPRSFGSGGGAKLGDTVLGGNGASGRVVFSFAIQDSSFSRYKADDFVNGTDGEAGYWPDRSDPTNVAKRAQVIGLPTKTSSTNGFGAGNGGDFQVVQGTPQDQINFPMNLSNYTLFTVARYNETNGGTYQRIFDGTQGNWLSGFWGGRNGPKSGIAYHGDPYEDNSDITPILIGGWIDPADPHQASKHGFDWVVSSDQKNLYRSNGVKRSRDDYRGDGPGQLTINAGGSSYERSDFQVADVMSFDRELSAEEYQAVETYLGDVYDICMGSCPPPGITSTSPLVDGVVNGQYGTVIGATSSENHPMSFALVGDGNLPPGLSLDSQTGSISGVPSSSGLYSFAVKVTDTVNHQVTIEDFTIMIGEDFSPPPTPEPFQSDFDFSRFTWKGVGSQIQNIVGQVPDGQEPPAVLGSNSMSAYWVPDVNADPISQGIKIPCNTSDGPQTDANLSVSSLSCPSVDLSEFQPGLSARLTRSFTASDPWHQVSVELTNSLLGEPITGAIAYRIELSSGQNTVIEMTSDGDLLLEDTDTWFLTSDSVVNSRPVSLHYFGYLLDGRVAQEDAAAGAGNFWITKPITVEFGSSQKHRFIDGFTDLSPWVTSNEAVIVAMKAADQLENQKWRDSNILNSDLSQFDTEDRDLPALRMQYDCRDFGRNTIYPVVVQSDGQPIGCDLDVRTITNPDPGGELYSLNSGLYPSVAQDAKAGWIRRFQTMFPNATPRLGWACDDCTITSEGPVYSVDEGEALADGLPLGFTASIDDQDDLDRILISPKGYVQVHETGATNSGKVISAFGNTNLGNSILVGDWNDLPEYDFFYWGRTAYQGRLAFVVTWVKIPTLDNGNPIDADPTTIQLMLVSDNDPDSLPTYFESPEPPTTSGVDIIWNFDSIQGQGANPLAFDSGDLQDPAFFSGIADVTGGGRVIFSDLFTAGDQSATIGAENESCPSTCVIERILNNRLQSSVNGRYVLGFRNYELQGMIARSGILAPAAPRQVEVIREVAESATLSWSRPLPWVMPLYQVPSGASPNYGYRIEYAVNTRGESDCVYQDRDSCFSVYPSLSSPPIAPGDDELIVSGSGDGERLSISIPNLKKNEQYTFRVYATYAGINLPEDPSNPAVYELVFSREVRSSAATANEAHASDLQIIPVATDPNPMAVGAQGIAGLLAGNLSVTNATINGSPFAYGQTAKSIATFSGGTDAIGFEEGIVITPLTDARTFQRGSGITEDGSSGKVPDWFLDPNHRLKYNETVDAFTQFLSTQESWKPNTDSANTNFAPVFNCDEEPECAFGTTVLQFDVENPQSDSFLKFEYALAGLESTEVSESTATPEVYGYPDGFGLFVGGINQENSCALIPQVSSETVNQRFVSMGNALNSRLASEVRFDSDLNAETVSAIMSCVIDTSVFQSDTITITMAIANANDVALSTGVFIKSNSIRFEPTLINVVDVPAATEGDIYQGLEFTTSGISPTSWSSNGLPNGMNVTTSGTLEGTPTEFGSFNFTLNALDQNDQILAAQTFTIVVIKSENGNLAIHDRFLQGRYVEVGIGGNGHFGSSGDAPDGYHPRVPVVEPEGPDVTAEVKSRRIGFVSDRDRDGWGVGKDDGDFFVPGTPFEGFGIDAGGLSYFNNHETTDIGRLTDLTENEPTVQKNTWTSEVMPNGLQVTQVSAVPVNEQRLDVTVTLANTSSSDLNDVYYARQVDNDAKAYECGGGYEVDGLGWASLNTVVAQAETSDEISLVSSIMMDDCRDDREPTDLSASHSYLGMISTDPSSVAALQAPGFGAQRATDFALGVSEEECLLRDDIYGDKDTCKPVMVEPGSKTFGDHGIGLGFNLGTIAANTSRTITFSYILSPEQAQEIIEEHNGQNDIQAPSISAMQSNLVAVNNSQFFIDNELWIERNGGPISYFTVSPELPAGLSFDPRLGDIRGTPTQPIGATSFSLTAHNLAGTSSVDFLLAVVDGPYLSNNAGVLTASWPSTSSGIAPSYDYQISVNGGASWSDSILVENVSSPLMSVPLNVSLGSTYSFRVRVAGSSEDAWLNSQPFFYGLSGCNSPASELNVLMLSAPSVGETPGTNPGTLDANILSDICSSQYVDVEIFDGQGFGAGAIKGSEDAWRSALEDVDVVVLPSLTYGSLRGSELMSVEAYSLLSEWVSKGGRLVLTGAAGYVNELSDLAGLVPGEIDVVNVTEEMGFRREDTTNTSLPMRLPTYGQPGLDLFGINSASYFVSYMESANYMSTSLASTFVVGHGSVVALSNPFANTDASWRKVLTQSIHSTLKSSITIRENDMYWYMLRGELYNGLSETQASAMVRLGSGVSQTTITCNNTPANPAIISRTKAGTTVNCGSVLINDGIVDTPVSVRLSRFFAADASWVKTSVAIANRDSDNRYSTSLWYGGALGVGNEPLVEVDGQQVDSTDDLEFDGQVLVVGAGSSIGNSPEDGNGFMVIRVSAQTPSDVFGGGLLKMEQVFSSSQVWSVNDLSLNHTESTKYSWFETYSEFAPGCDRLASKNAWLQSKQFLDDSSSDYAEDGFESIEQMNFPDLSELNCSPYSGLVQDIEVSQSNRRVDLEWPRTNGATRYHLEYRIAGDNSWNVTNVVNLGQGDRDSYQVAGLQNGQTYEFRIRPIQENRTSAGDVGKGIWSTTSPVTVTFDPTPTVSPTPTPSVSPTPVALKTQVTPIVPESMKNKKTIKFTMKTKAGLPLVVTSSGKCKTSKILVKKKIGKKIVTTQTGWLVTANGIGKCSVKLSAKGSAVWKPLKVTKVVKVVK